MLENFLIWLIGGDLYQDFFRFLIVIFVLNSLIILLTVLGRLCHEEEARELEEKK